MRRLAVLLLCAAVTVLCAGRVSGDEGATKDLEERVSRLEHLLRGVNFEGYIRLRGNAYINFDLDSDDRRDRRNDFVDLRGHLTLEVEREKISGAVSMDVAGNDFNDGAVLGYDDPGRNRPVDVGLRYLYLEYRGVPFIRIGRQPGRLGHGIASNIIRDMLKVGLRFDRFGVTGVWVKGAEGDTQTAEDTPTSRRVLGAANGDDQDLDAYGVVMDAASRTEKWEVQFYALRKFDTTDDDRYTEHLLVGLSADWNPFDGFSLLFEANYLGGDTAAGAQGAAVDERAEIDAAMFYIDGTYNHGRLSAGAAFGAGTGDNDPSDRKLKNFQNFFMDETGFHYTYIFSDDIHGYDGRTSDIGRGSGFANISWAQIHLEYSLDRLSFGGSYTLMRATVGQFEGSGPLGTASATSGERTKDVGYELDARLSYDIIDKSARVYAMAGVFFPGKIYGDADRASKAELALEYRF